MNFFGPGIPVFISHAEQTARQAEIKIFDAYYLFPPIVGIQVVGAPKNEALLSFLALDAPAFSEPQEWNEPVVGLQAIDQMAPDCPVSIVAVEPDILTDICPCWNENVIGLIVTEQIKDSKIAFIVAENINSDKNYIVGLYGKFLEQL